MSYDTQKPARREDIAKRLADIIRITHDTADKKLNLVKDSSAEITTFLFKGTPSENKLLYQFDPENQLEFEKSAQVLDSAISAINYVIIRMKKELFPLESMSQPAETTMVGTGSQQVSKNLPAKVESRSLLERIGLSRPKKTVQPHFPYQEAIDEIKKKEEGNKQWLLFREYQAFSVGKQKYTNKVGMLLYLDIHRTRFRFHISPPIIANYQEFLTYLTSDERAMALQGLMAQEREMRHGEGLFG